MSTKILIIAFVIATLICGFSAASTIDEAQKDKTTTKGFGATGSYEKPEPPGFEGLKEFYKETMKILDEAERRATQDHGRLEDLSDDRHLNGQGGYNSGSSSTMGSNSGNYQFTSSSSGEPSAPPRPNRILPYKPGDPVPKGYQVRAAKLVEKVIEVHGDPRPLSDIPTETRTIIIEEQVLVPEDWVVKGTRGVKNPEYCEDELESKTGAIGPSRRVSRKRPVYGPKTALDHVNRAVKVISLPFRIWGGKFKLDHTTVYTGWDKYPGGDLDKYRPGYKVRKKDRKRKTHNCKNSALPPPCAPPERPPATRK